MDDLSGRTCCVVDNGLFPELARTLAPSFDRVLYYSSWETSFPRSNAVLIGEGFPGVQRVNSIWPVIDEIDSGVSLIDLEKKKRTLLFSCGTVCWFEGAAWLDDETLVVAEMRYVWPATDPILVVKTILNVYSMADSKVTVYEGPHMELRELKKAPDDPLDQRLKQIFPGVKK